MDKDKAGSVVEQLRGWNVPATVVPQGMQRAAVRVLLPGGREAVWDADDAAGLDAQVLRDGMLVGYVPTLPDSAGLPAGHTAWLIATADYELGASRRPDGSGSDRGRPPQRPPSPPPPRPGGRLRRMSGRVVDAGVPRPGGVR